MAAIQSKPPVGRRLAGTSLAAPRPAGPRLAGRPYGRRTNDRRSATLAHMLQAPGRPLADTSEPLDAERSTNRDRHIQCASAPQSGNLDITSPLLRKQHIHAAEAVGRLTSGIAHDFNNILASIMGYSDLLACALQRTDPGVTTPADEQRYVHEIVQASERARSLVRQLLLYSHGGGSELRPTSSACVLAIVLPKLRALLPSGIEVRSECIAQPACANMDAALISQALLNIALNACDAIQGQGPAKGKGNELLHGHICLTAEAVTTTAQQCASCHRRFGGEFLRLSMRDSGPGVPKGSLTRLFEPYFTTKDVGRGTGLGLSVVHGIVHEQGGHIDVQSNADGATFSLLLPMTVPLQPGAAGTHAAEQPSPIDLAQERLPRQRLRKCERGECDVHSS